MGLGRVLVGTDESFFPPVGSCFGLLLEEEASFLEQEAKILEGQLKAVKKRLHDLRASAEKKNNNMRKHGSLPAEHGQGRGTYPVLLFEGKFCNYWW